MTVRSRGRLLSIDGRGNAITRDAFVRRFGIPSSRTPKLVAMCFFLFLGGGGGGGGGTDVAPGGPRRAPRQRITRYTPNCLGSGRFSKQI